MQSNYGINPGYTERDAKANAESTAKYAKYAKYAKKMRMQRNMKCNSNAMLAQTRNFPRRLAPTPPCVRRG